MTRSAFARQHFATILLLLTILASCVSYWRVTSAFEPHETVMDGRFEKDQTTLVTPRQATPKLVNDWCSQGYQIALYIEEADDLTISKAKQIYATRGHIDYFFEVARNPKMASKHPDWMASIQGHHEWMQAHRKIRKPNTGEVIKNYPWVPVFNREPFEAHLARINKLLLQLPVPRRIWLNDIQGAPSACGCGHPLCRWTSDYGPIKTATPIGDSAPAEFVQEVQKFAAKSQVIPIMTGECEKADQHTLCGGVGCYEGICWRAFTRQLDAVSRQSRQIGVACFYKEFKRDLPRYREKAGWIRYSLESFEKMPRSRKGIGVKANRLFAVLQGWNTTAEEMQQQIQIAGQLKPAGILICLARVDQSWKPLLVPVKD